MTTRDQLIEMTTFVYNPHTGECRLEEDPPPRADLVEVVRCKDCEQWYPEEDDEYGRCRHLESYTTGSWYCGDGERREE